jgi:hypothetical protein
VDLLLFGAYLYKDLVKIISFLLDFLMIILPLIGINGENILHKKKQRIAAHSCEIYIELFTAAFAADISHMLPILTHRFPAFSSYLGHMLTILADSFPPFGSDLSLLLRIH